MCRPSFQWAAAAGELARAPMGPGRRSCWRTSRPAISTRKRRGCAGAPVAAVWGGEAILLRRTTRVASVADRVISMRDGRIIDDTLLAAGADDSRLLASLISLEA